MKNKKAFIFLFVWVLILGVIFVYISQDDFIFKKKQNISQENVEKNSECTVQNCHGMEIVCGKEKVESCSQEYQIGDACRQYARCETRNGECVDLEMPHFEECKSCVEDCKKNYKEDSKEIFECEGECHKEINETEEAVLN